MVTGAGAGDVLDADVDALGDDARADALVDNDTDSVLRHVEDLACMRISDKLMTLGCWQRHLRKLGRTSLAVVVRVRQRLLDGSVALHTSTR